MPTPLSIDTDHTSRVVSPGLPVSPAEIVSRNPDKARLTSTLIKQLLAANNGWFTAILMVGFPAIS